jgi:hypothetical protein
VASAVQAVLAASAESAVRAEPEGQGALVAQAGPVVSVAQAARAGQGALAVQAGPAAAGKRPIVRQRVQRAARAAALVLPLGPRGGRT